MPLGVYAAKVMDMQHQKVFSALADPTRRQILEELAGGDLAVGQLVERVEASQPTVSKHLRVLRDAALVVTRAEGQRRYYRLQPAGLEAAIDWFSPLVFGGEKPAAKPAQQAPAPVAPAEPSAGTRDLAVVDPAREAADAAASREFGRTVNATVEQVADRAQHLLGRLPKPKFGRRR